MTDQEHAAAVYAAVDELDRLLTEASNAGLRVDAKIVEPAWADEKGVEVIGRHLEVTLYRELERMSLVEMTADLARLSLLLTKAQAIADAKRGPWTNAKHRV